MSSPSVATAGTSDAYLCFQIPKNLPSHTPLNHRLVAPYPSQHFASILTERLSREIQSQAVRRSWQRILNRDWKAREATRGLRFSGALKPRISHFEYPVSLGVHRLERSRYTWSFPLANTQVTSMYRHFNRLLNEYQEMSWTPGRSLQVGTTRLLVMSDDKITRSAWRDYEFSQGSTLDDRARWLLSSLPEDRSWKTIIWTRPSREQYIVQVSNKLIANEWRRSYVPIQLLDPRDPPDETYKLSSEIETVLALKKAGMGPRSVPIPSAKCIRYLPGLMGSALHQ